MFHIVLYQPEIPPNTGNIIRLSANTGCCLHLIEPLGFNLDDKQLKRAGLDYHALTNVKSYPSLELCLAQFDPERCFALTTKGTTKYHQPRFQAGDVFVFGPESRGLPAELRDSFKADNKLCVPQLTHARSLNLANAVSIMVYEAWRQNDFAGS